MARISINGIDAWANEMPKLPIIEYFMTIFIVDFYGGLTSWLLYKFVDESVQDH